MKLIVIFMLLGWFAFAQDTPEPTPAPEAPKSADEWAIEKPASNPTGDPVELRHAIEPGFAHRLVIASSANMQTMMGPMKIELGMSQLLKVLDKGENGEANFEMPLEFTKMSANGNDMLGMFQGMEPKVTGRLDDRGMVVSGSIQVKGMGNASLHSSSYIEKMAAQMRDKFEQILPELPKKPVRVGEVWDGPKRYFARVAEVKGGEVEGSCYEKFLEIKTVDGARVAVVKYTCSIRIHGDNITVQNMLGKGEVRVKAEGIMHFGLDGYMRSNELEIKSKMDMIAGGMAMQGSIDMRVKVTGGKVRFDAESAKPKEEPKPGDGG